MSPTVTVPCGANPDAWWHPHTHGYAIHQCLHHCPALTWCRRSGHRADGAVTAGILYAAPTEPGRDVEEAPLQPMQVGCVVAPTVEVPVVRCGMCGSVMPDQDPRRYCRPACASAAELVRKAANQEARTLRNRQRRAAGVVVAA